MAEFDPFAFSGTKRLPTPDERENGFPCGPADRPLFNMMFYRIEAELGHLIDFAGIVGDDEDLTQVRKAIQALIASVLVDTGFDTSPFVLFDQARTRLPIFPEVQNSDGKIVITSTGAGNVRVPSGTTFLHRGIFPIVTSVTDLVTTASKTYHLRWNPIDGFILKDLANVGYNPTVAVESNAAFDSAYDDMLVARIVTNASNIPTITNLVNKDRLARVAMIAGVWDPASPAITLNQTAFLLNDTYNWARTPKNYILTPGKLELTSPPSGPLEGDWNFGVPTVANATTTVIPLDRYRLAAGMMCDYAFGVTVQFSASA